MDEMSGLSQLERVCAEIVQTENVYVEDLRQVIEVSSCEILKSLNNSYHCRKFSELLSTDA